MLVSDEANDGPVSNTLGCQTKANPLPNWIGIQRAVQATNTINHMLYFQHNPTTAVPQTAPEIYIKKQLTEQGLLVEQSKLQTLWWRCHQPPNSSDENQPNWWLVDGSSHQLCRSSPIKALTNPIEALVIEWSWPIWVFRRSRTEGSQTGSTSTTSCMCWSPWRTQRTGQNWNLNGPLRRSKSCWQWWVVLIPSWYNLWGGKKDLLWWPITEKAASCWF